MSRRRLLFLLALVPQLLVLGTMIVRAEVTLREGVPCLFEVRAVDPVDLLSGRYVEVPLAVEVVPRALLDWDPGGFQEGDVLFARVVPEPEPAQVVQLSTFEPDPGVLFLRGIVRRVDDADVILDYGLGRFYFAADGVDPSLWQADLERRPELLLRVRVRDGEAVIDDLLVDGVPYAAWNEARPREDG